MAYSIALIVVLVLYLLLIIILLKKGIRIVQQGTFVIVERFGRYQVDRASL